jgi:glutamyl-tRNA reductase
MRKPSSFESARREELDRGLRLLRRGADPARVLDEMSRRLMNKLIHAPTKALRDVSGDRDTLLSLFAALTSGGPDQQTSSTI